MDRIEVAMPTVVGGLESTHPLATGDAELAYVPFISLCM